MCHDLPDLHHGKGDYLLIDKELAHKTKQHSTEEIIMKRTDKMNAAPKSNAETEASEKRGNQRLTVVCCYRQ
jgi:hypothetical protein